MMKKTQKSPLQQARRRNMSDYLLLINTYLGIGVGALLGILMGYLIGEIYFKRSQKTVSEGEKK